MQHLHQTTIEEREERVQEVEAVGDSIKTASGQNGAGDPMNTQRHDSICKLCAGVSQPDPSVEREAGQAEHSLLAKEFLAINFF